MEKDKKIKVQSIMRFIYLALAIFFIISAIIFIVMGFKVKDNRAFSNILWILFVSFGFLFLIVGLICAVLCVHTFIVINEYDKSNDERTIEENKEIDSSNIIEEKKN